MHRKLVSALLAFFLIFLAAAGSSPLQAAKSPRNLVVYFEFLDNANGVEEAVEYIFQRLLKPGDQLIIQSPTRSYGFSPASLSRQKADLAAMMKGKLRGDIAQAAQNYKQVLQDLDSAAREIAELAYPTTGAVDPNKDMNELFILYRQALTNLKQLRKVDEASLRRLSGVFRNQRGENHIIVLFEREFRPIPRREALNVLAGMPVFALQANELFASVNMNELFDVAAVGEYFQQVPLVLHFIYVTSKNTTAGGERFENSGDIYSAFSKIAQATAGVCVATAEPADGLNAVMKAWKGK